MIAWRRRDDIILAGAGNDTIRGSVGRDLIVGDQGNDLIDGGDAEDVIWAACQNMRKRLGVLVPLRQSPLPHKSGKRSVGWSISIPLWEVVLFLHLDECR